MSDVYIIYPHENVNITQRLHELLSQQWDVWWDDNIVGEWRPAIEKNLAETKCVLALFSDFSRKATVTDELRVAQKHTQNIIGLTIDESDPPYPFGSLTSIDLREWDGDASHPGFLQLQRKIARVVLPRKAPSRLQATSGSNLLIPNIFMSVSSHETQFSPSDALEVLRVHKTSSILVSAYDLVKSHDKREMLSKIKAYRKAGGFVLIDSGNYEARRLQDKEWKPIHYRQALMDTPHDWAFCFDVAKPNPEPEKAIEQIVKAVKRDSKFTTASMLPIVHVSQDDAGLSRLPVIVKGISERLNPQVIAIPERELGAGLAARASTMKKIRKSLDELPYYQPIHLLGTGNPWSIAVLVAAGADTFDGLEWCRFAIDPRRGRLHHFQHFDFFKNSGERTPFLDMVDAQPTIGYAGQVAFYNLEYYAEFGQLMRSMISTKDAEPFATGVTRLFSNELRKLFPEIFP